MNKRIILSIGAVVVIGILIIVINIFTPWPQKTQNNNRAQEQPENRPVESSVEQQEPDFEEEVIEQEQTIQDENMILLN
jgi:flagellar biosynthesis/type III secretory pathway M-ring protein FliF/YscJ